MNLWLVLAVVGGLAAGLLVVLVGVLLCRRRRRLASKKAEPRVSVVLPNMARTRKKTSESVPLPFDLHDGNGGQTSDDEEDAHGDDQLATNPRSSTHSLETLDLEDAGRLSDIARHSILSSSSATSAGFVLPAAPRGRKVSHEMYIFNESTAEMDGDLVRYMYTTQAAAARTPPETPAANSASECDNANTAADDASESNQSRLSRPHIDLQDALSLTSSCSFKSLPSARGSAVSCAHSLDSTDICLATDDTEEPSGAEVPWKVRPEWLRPSALSSTGAATTCHGFLRYSVCLRCPSPTVRSGQHRLGGGHSHGTAQLHVAVVTALALAGVSGNAHVLTQVELVHPNCKVQIPAKYTKKRPNVRHTKAVMRGGKVVGSQTEDDIKNPYMVDAAEYRSMVLNRWKSEALDKEESEGFESDSSDLLPLQRRWPFHEELQPFPVKVSQDVLSEFHLRFTVWARELSKSVRPSNPSVEVISNGHAAVSASMPASPASTTSGGLLSSMKKRMRGESSRSNVCCVMRLVGEVLVSLNDFKPLTTSQTRTDELASPVLSRQDRPHLSKVNSLKSNSPAPRTDRPVSFPGQLQLELTYWQAPMHRLDVAVTAPATLPTFMDKSKNKARDTVLKIRLNVNGKRVQEQCSSVVSKCQTPNYQLMGSFDLTRVGLERDQVELVVAVKTAQGHVRVRSRSFAVRPLVFSSMSDIQDCKDHWNEALMKPGMAVVQDHALHMDTLRLGMR